jgi:hypothetical protein
MILIQSPPLSVTSILEHPPRSPFIQVVSPAITACTKPRLARNTMSETAINDYLTKQITVNRNIVCHNLHSDPILLIKVHWQVTFRLLSRALSIHVNAAKL